MAENSKEAIEELYAAWKEFNKHSSLLFRALNGEEPAKDAWEEFRSKCQQVSGWLEHGQVEKLEWTEMKKTLDNAEAHLLNYRRYSRKELYYR